LYSDCTNCTQAVPTVLRLYQLYSDCTNCTQAVPTVLRLYQLYSGCTNCTQTVPIVLRLITLRKNWRRIYLERILDTQPWETLSCREMSHGRTPLWASSTILCRTTSGNGRPFTKTPPSWFTPPWP